MLVSFTRRLGVAAAPLWVRGGAGGVMQGVRTRRSTTAYVNAWDYRVAATVYSDQCDVLTKLKPDRPGTIECTGGHPEHAGYNRRTA